MLNEFIDAQLAGIDNLDELKVTLVTLRLLAQKQIETPMVSEAQIMEHVAVREGLRMPTIQLRPALQMAVARGTLLRVGDDDAAARYLINTPANREAVDVLRRAANGPTASTHDRARALVAQLGREIARLEHLEAYPPAHDDVARVDDWLARGYTEREMLDAIRAALLHPRARNGAARSLAHSAKALTQRPPEAPTDYYDVIIARKRTPSEEIVNLRHRLGREPNGREFAIARQAVAIYGLAATIESFARLTRNGALDVDAVLPSLADAENAALAGAHDVASRDQALREAVRIYESAFGLPPTALVAGEIRQTLIDAPDLAFWRSVFDYALRNNKRSWAYVKKLLLNPSPDVFVPEPANDVARAAFETYKKRVNRQLDAAVANDINQVAQKVTDPATWSSAFDKAAAANALRWDYIKSVLTSTDKPKPEKKSDGKRQPARPTRGGTYTRPQVNYTDEQRKAAEERARRALEEQEDD
jgi:hypothetical protein